MTSHGIKRTFAPKKTLEYESTVHPKSNNIVFCFVLFGSRYNKWFELRPLSSSWILKLLNVNPHPHLWVMDFLNYLAHPHIRILDILFTICMTVLLTKQLCLITAFNLIITVAHCLMTLRFQIKTFINIFLICLGKLSIKKTH